MATAREQTHARFPRRDMTTGDRTGTVLVVSPAAADAGPTPETVFGQLTCEVVYRTDNAVSPQAVVQIDPDVVSLCGTNPAWIENTLESLSAHIASTRVVIVAPPSGSERLATTAFRSGADDYVPLEDPAAVVERIDAHLHTEGEETLVSRSSLAELLATTLPDGVFVIDHNGVYLESTVRPDAANLHTLSPDDLVGHTLWDAFPSTVADRLYECLEAALETNERQRIEYEAETIEGTNQFEGQVVAMDPPAKSHRTVLWLSKNVTERENRQAALKERQAQAELLNRTSTTIRQVIQTLVGAPTQAAVEDEVCAHLVESDLYCCAWVSRPSADGDVFYQTGNGDATAYLEEIQSIDLDSDRPIIWAIEENDVYWSNELLTDEAMPDSLSEAAAEDGVHSAIAVPLSSDASVYGVLTVLSRRKEAFKEREREALRFLGETVGFVINAIKTRRLLFADAVTILEMKVEEGDSLAFKLTTEYECRAELEWSGETADGRAYQYVRFDGIDGQTLLDEARGHPTVKECRLIHDGDEEATIEIRLYESAVRTLMGYGATIRTVTVEDGVATVTVEVSRETDTREVIEALQRVYESTRLTAKRDVDRSVETAADRRSRLVDRLTERQLTALRLAYYGGYFDWPRGSTGEDIAAAMNISPPTMHQHLRRGLEELLQDFFEAGK